MSLSVIAGTCNLIKSLSQVALGLWIVSFIGSFFNFLTLVYIGEFCGALTFLCNQQFKYHSCCFLKQFMHFINIFLQVSFSVFPLL